MISIQVIMIVSHLCLAPTSKPEDIQAQKNCTESIIKCANNHGSQLTPEKFNMCIVEYELSKK